MQDMLSFAHHLLLLLLYPQPTFHLSQTSTSTPGEGRESAANAPMPSCVHAHRLPLTLWKKEETES